MEVLIYSFVFIFSFLLISFASNKLVTSLSKIAKFLSWKEFVVAFFTIALGSSLPNLIVGIFSAFYQLPELSFGDVVGGNIVNLTLVVALSSFFSRGGILASSRTVQGSAKFTLLIAILPLILAFDGALTRNDGVILLLFFLVYIYWLFSKKERFIKIYDGEKIERKDFLSQFVIFLISIIVLFLGGKGIIESARFFTEKFGLSLEKIGILLVGLGNALPEMFFSIEAAKRNQDWLILGDLMGSVIITATLVLGIVALISPISVKNIPAIFLARFFLFISAILFLMAIKTEHRITKKEGLILIFIYLIFVLTQLFT